MSSGLATARVRDERFLFTERVLTHSVFTEMTKAIGRSALRDDSASWARGVRVSRRRVGEGGCEGARGRWDASWGMGGYGGCD